MFRGLMSISPVPMQLGERRLRLGSRFTLAYGHQLGAGRGEHSGLEITADELRPAELEQQPCPIRRTSRRQLERSLVEADRAGMGIERQCAIARVSDACQDALGEDEVAWLRRCAPKLQAAEVVVGEH